MSIEHEILPRLNVYLSEIAGHKPDISLFLSQLSSLGSCFFFGGTPRDIALQRQPRDLDIVVNTADGKLEEVVGQFPHRRNRFGGYHLEIAQTKVDIWCLENTWAFRAGLLTASPYNLTRSVFLNIDGIAVDPFRCAVYAEPFLEYCLTRELDIVLRENPFPDLCVLRTLVFLSKEKCSASELLREYISDWHTNEQEDISRLQRMQMAHYGVELFSARDIRRLLQRLTSFSNSGFRTRHAVRVAV